MHSYLPLTEATNEIRLLHLLPASFDEVICCRLQHAELDETLNFTALSYTWGDPTVRQPILIDDNSIEVTLNLYDALQHMRHETDTRILWVDAVCINQDDLDERGKQVLRMRDIYTLASTVEVWIGKVGPDGDDVGAVDLVKKMASFFDNLEDVLNKGIKGEGHETLRGEMGKAAPMAVKSLTDLFKRPWWTRIWVVQELSLARQATATVRVGHLTSSWLSWLVTAHAIESAWFIVADLATSVSADRHTEGFLNGIRMSQCRIVNASMPGFTLLELLNQHRDCEATNARDKVYGLLGLAADAELMAIIPDYRATPEEVFTDFFRRHVTTTNSLDMICASRYPRNLESLPSWVPDWSTDQTTPGICINDRYIGGNNFPGSPISQFQKYVASKATLPQVVFEQELVCRAMDSATPTLRQDTMSIKFVPIGKVVALGIVDDGMQFQDLDTFGLVNGIGKSGSDSEVFNNWMNLVIEDGPTWDAISKRYGQFEVIATFCRTLVGDRDNFMRKPVRLLDSDGESEASNLSVDSDGQILEEEGDENGKEELHTQVSTAPRGQKRDHSTMKGETSITHSNPFDTQPDHEFAFERTTQSEGSSSTSGDADGTFSMFDIVGMADHSLRTALEVCWGKRLAILDSGHIGLVHQHSAIGDIVAIVFGCTMPLVLRRIDALRGTFICESYFHGVMDGEILDEVYEAETIILE